MHCRREYGFRRPVTRRHRKISSFEGTGGRYPHVDTATLRTPILCRSCRPTHSPCGCARRAQTPPAACFGQTTHRAEIRYHDGCSIGTRRRPRFAGPSLPRPAAVGARSRPVSPPYQRHPRVGRAGPTRPQMERWPCGPLVIGPYSAISRGERSFEHHGSGITVVTNLKQFSGHERSRVNSSQALFDSKPLYPLSSQRDV